MKVIYKDNEHIKFDNGTEIVSEHYYDRNLHEESFADFSELNGTGFYDTEHSEILKIELVPNYGFRVNGYGVPCYSSIDGYYTGNVDFYIKYSNGEVIEYSVLGQ